MLKFKINHIIQKITKIDIWRRVVVIKRISIFMKALKIMRGGRGLRNFTGHKGELSSRIETCHTLHDNSISHGQYE